MLMNYMKNIISLDIQVGGNEDFLIKPNLIFCNLESLSIRSTNSHRTSIECMIAKHANHLNNLELNGLLGRIVDLTVPALPVLDSLVLDGIGTKAVWSILQVCKYTITSLEIRGTMMNSPSNYEHAQDTNSSIESRYRIPNIKCLVLRGFNSLDLVLCNANTLVSLTLMDVEIPPVWTEFPQLKELNIRGGGLLSILAKCKETLECLVFSGYDCNIDEYATVIPKLTDLYLLNPKMCSKFLSVNNKNIEFLYLNSVSTEQFNDCVQLERIKRVIMKSSFSCNYDKKDKTKLLRLCPNSRVTILNEKNMIETGEFMKSRCRRRDYNIDVDAYLQ